MTGSNPRHFCFIGVVLTIVGSKAVNTGTVDEPFVPTISVCSQTTTQDYKLEYCLSQDEYNTICSVVMAEAGAEPYIGQKAVAQAILNACRLNKKRPLDIIRDYQYTKKRPAPSKSVEQAVFEVFNLGEEVVDPRVTIFYAPALCTSKYHESQIYACTIGGHRFFIQREFSNK